MAAGGEDPTALFNFWERLQKNPSWRSVQQLWGFLQHQNIPLTPDGCFLAYKGVREDYKDKHSGTFDNSPGKVHKMPRNKISDDPNETCHYGFHVGALEYARDFAGGQRIVICKVDPEHVVCVPFDASQQKMRVCEYVVIGNYGSKLPSTVFEEEKLVQASEPASPKVDDVDEDDDDLINEDEDDDSGSSGGDDYDEDDNELINEDDDDEDDVIDQTENAEKVEDDLPPPPVTKKEERPKAPKAPVAKAAVPKAGDYKKYNKMDFAELSDVSLDDLRKYATYGLQIVGASKIPGGKMALISSIIRTRKKS